MKIYRNTILLLILMLWSAYSTAQNIRQAKDTIIDKSIIAPESMTANLNDLLHEWQIDLSESAEDCSQGVNLVYPDSVYINRLYRLPSEMELSYNSVVRSYIDMYTVRRRSQVSFMLAIGELYFPMFEELLDKNNLPLELKYLPVIESALNPIAVSRVGATGLWQFMMRTGKGYGLEVNSLVDERRDPYKATEAAVRYLKDLYAIYGDWNLVIAAYNCGPGNVNKAIARSGGKKDYWEIYYHLPRETRGYVPAFIAANYVMNYYNEHKICPVAVDNYAALDTIHINQQMHFGQISETLDIPLADLRRLNPQFKKDIVPGNFNTYALVLPTKKVIAFIDQKEEILNHKRSELLSHRKETDEYINGSSSGDSNGSTTNIYYKIRSGDSLGKIASKNRVTVTQLKSWNNLKSNSIRAGRSLIVGKKVVEQKVDTSEEKLLANASTTDESGEIAKSINQYYRVKKGDTLGAIAKKNKVTVAQLKSWNGLKSNNIGTGNNLIVQQKIVMEKAPETKTETPSSTDSKTNADSNGGNIISDYLKNEISEKIEGAKNNNENTVEKTSQENDTVSETDMESEIGTEIKVETEKISETKTGKETVTSKVS